jgi:hypothetical protein
LKTPVSARKYYGFCQFFMWRCSGRIIWGLFFPCLYPLPPLICKYIAQICQWPQVVWCWDELLVVVAVALNIINILIIITKLLKTPVSARKYYGFCQFFMWRCSGGIIWGLFSTCFDFWEIISTEGGISGVIKKPTRDYSLIQMKGC